MVRRASILLSFFSIALLLYAMMFYGIVRRIALVLIHVVCLHPHENPPPDGVWGVPPLPKIVDIFGLHVYLSVLIALTLSPLGLLVANEIACRHRRRRRDRLGQCIECGFQLKSWRGRCPGCGVRIGPG